MARRLRTHSEFDQFLLDHFDADVRRVVPPSTADQLARENALLAKVGPKVILRALGGRGYSLHWLGLAGGVVVVLAAIVHVQGRLPFSAAHSVDGIVDCVSKEAWTCQPSASPRPAAVPPAEHGAPAGPPIPSRPTLASEVAASSSPRLPRGAARARRAAQGQPDRRQELERLQHDVIDACKKRDESTARRLFAQLAKTNGIASGAVQMDCANYDIKL